MKKSEFVVLRSTKDGERADWVDGFINDSGILGIYQEEINKNQYFWYVVHIRSGTSSVPVKTKKQAILLMHELESIDFVLPLDHPRFTFRDDGNFENRDELLECFEYFEICSVLKYV